MYLQPKQGSETHTEAEKKKPENKKQLSRWCESKRFNYLSDRGLSTYLTHGTTSTGLQPHTPYYDLLVMQMCLHIHTHMYKHKRYWLTEESDLFQ